MMGANLAPYGSPVYFIGLIVSMLPIIIALYYGRRLKLYETIWTGALLLLTFGGDGAHQLMALTAYVFFECAVMGAYHVYRRQKNATWVFAVAILVSLIPLILVKLGTMPSLSRLSLLGFLGISYITFKTVQILIEFRDGTLKEVNGVSVIRFLLFFPTISSGPIDRFRRFEADYDAIPDRAAYTELVGQAINKLFQGLVYKFILGFIFGTWLLPQVTEQLMRAHHIGDTGYLILMLVAYMYVWSMYLFFDFAGYSLFAIAISNLMGVHTPANFNAPFRSHNIKDFWNRWHMTLSFWFRDFIFMRVSLLMMKKRWFKNRIRVSQVAYLVNFLVMGFWHGLTWYYIAYGLFHASAIIINDYWLRFKGRHAGMIKHSWLTEGVAIFLTFNTICFSFLIFSGILDKLI
ncbi:D-alanyl-lipoteichoic acid biosynthesis protein DltB [Secundilactobacillus kimchicus]|uniref:D-alanyl-lipoteichoic acid biosynthesis protein DltB n=1 Tax=Secundilactobacillus kimchicus TaxID=528209 RepID=UPI0024A9725D|nr:D-alanyl-lipoteichoic acid biosynthesis protein DltB [Secundilactobacillus kimchicus]